MNRNGSRFCGNLNTKIAYKEIKKTTWVNVHRNHLWWNSYECCFLVSTKEKNRTDRNLIKKRRGNIYFIILPNIKHAQIGDQNVRMRFLLKHSDGFSTLWRQRFLQNYWCRLVISSVSSLFLSEIIRSFSDFFAWS